MKCDEKYQMLVTTIKHTMIVLFPLGKLKAENTTRTFVQSRSSMGEWSVGSTHTALFMERKRERERARERDRETERQGDRELERENR